MTKKKLGGKKYFEMLGAIDGNKQRGHKVIYAPARWPNWSRVAYQESFYKVFYA